MQMLAFVHAHAEAQGCAPTLREIAKEMGYVNLTAVRDVLHALAHKKCLLHTPGRARGYRVTNEGLRRLATGGAPPAEIPVCVPRRTLLMLVGDLQAMATFVPPPIAARFARALDCLRQSLAASPLAAKAEAAVIKSDAAAPAIV